VRRSPRPRKLSRLVEGDDILASFRPLAAWGFSLNWRSGERHQGCAHASDWAEVLGWKEELFEVRMALREHSRSEIERTERSRVVFAAG
jgi:hypothetical protein